MNRQHCGIENYLLPTVPNIAEYCKIAAEHQVIVGLRKQRLAPRRGRR